MSLSLSLKQSVGLEVYTHTHLLDTAFMLYFMKAEKKKNRIRAQYNKLLSNPDSNPNHHTHTQNFITKNVENQNRNSEYRHFINENIYTKITLNAMKWKEFNLIFNDLFVFFIHQSRHMYINKSFLSLNEKKKKAHFSWNFGCFFIVELHFTKKKKKKNQTKP